MADITITAANVKRGSNAIVDRDHDAGATIVAGKYVFLDPTTSKWKLADSNDTALDNTGGIALNGASDGQPLAVQTGGDITPGATLVPGTAYYLSETAGGIEPSTDLATSERVIQVGLARSATVLSLRSQDTGVTL